MRSIEQENKMGKAKEINLTPTMGQFSLYKYINFVKPTSASRAFVLFFFEKYNFTLKLDVSFLSLPTEDIL